MSSVSTVLQELRGEELTFCLEESGDVTGGKMLRGAFEAAEGRRCRGPGANGGGGGGVWVEEKRLGGQRFHGTDF